MPDLRDQSTHFAFGKNWASYAKTIDAERLDLAEQGLARLVGPSALHGRSFLDIGSGSGLHAVAAARLGAASIHAVDIDPDSVETTRAVLKEHAPAANYEIRQQSVFNLSPETTYDVVYSWGVLHHTGDMWAAIGRAAALVKPGGTLAIAIYSKTMFCGLWTVEKRLYSQSPAIVQAALRAMYKTAFVAVGLVRGRNPFSWIRNYASGNRGMNWDHDVHDWLGGYPYESATPSEVAQYLKGLGFTLERQFGQAPACGVLGTGCCEYAFRRTLS
jgi:2-polyprenyl-6-hydroxyphenyl methylase/3-demethylubiquinone-9 3-methyltransferase